VTAVSEAGDGSLLVLIPVFDDWDCLPALLERLGRALADAGRRAEVLLVDDGSTQTPPERLPTPASLDALRILHLRCNLGHERAICVGLTHAYQHHDAATIIVMDGDGEDRPEDVPRLLEALERGDPGTVVFAARARRSEGPTFRFFYLLYQVLHRLLVGRSIEVGSFSALPRRVLAGLVVMPQLWNHYAAAIMVSRTRWISIPTERGERIRGRSALDFVSLVVHGVSALSVYSDRIAVRVLLASGVLGVLFALSLVAHAATGGTVPVWANLHVALLSIALLSLVGVAATLSLLILSTRSRAHFVPLEGCALYVREIRSL
jgi:hypothetical protein